MKKKILILAFFVVSGFGMPLLTKAETTINHQFFQEFARALHDRDVSKVNYIAIKMASFQFYATNFCPLNVYTIGVSNTTTD